MADRIYLGGMTDTVVHCESDGTVIVEERQDAQSILDSNARKRNERFSNAGRDFQEAFDIPMVEVLRWQRECGAAMLSDEHMAYMDKKLRDPNYAFLHTAPKQRDSHIIIKGAR